MSHARRSTSLETSNTRELLSPAWSGLISDTSLSLKDILVERGEGRRKRHRQVRATALAPTVHNCGGSWKVQEPVGSSELNETYMRRTRGRLGDSSLGGIGYQEAGGEDVIGNVVGHQSHGDFPGE